MTEEIEGRKPTPQQKEIIEYANNLAVLAKPGSGKTFTIAEKIKFILKTTVDYRGVIAISYTNKASKELKNRVLNGGVEKKGSFFNTMTTFYLMEIIYPFGNHVFGLNSTEFIVAGKEEANNKVIEFRNNNTNVDYTNLLEEHIELLGELYRDGIILLESIDALALHIFDNSLSCRRYLRSRYTHIFIDEYQDCGDIQNKLFLRLVEAGLTGIAVGDKDQSIYGFAGKSSAYLIELASDNRFRPFYLDKNFRCNKSISNYSLRLLNENYEFCHDQDSRVIRAKVQGGEQELARFIDSVIPKLKAKYDIKKDNEFAILVKNNSTGKLISEALETKHKFFKPTALDDDSSLWASVFKNLLMSINNHESNLYEFVGEYYNPIDEEGRFKKLYSYAEVVKDYMLKDNVDEIIDTFISVANYIYPDAMNEATIDKLAKVLIDEKSIESYSPAAFDEVQIMTLHKSKGLEFAVVFHLNLHKYILPEEGKVNGRWGYKNYEQCRNLHYVGITRAEEVCILLTSTQRKNFKGEFKKGIPSEFFTINGLSDYSKRWSEYSLEL